MCKYEYVDLFINCMLGDYEGHFLYLLPDTMLPMELKVRK